ncbi:MAG: carbamoyltransferase HypF [Anaerolineaceae bacterium]|nr:carbamoyltransferase HypF [Anaerolineaceae bacterium]
MGTEKQIRRRIRITGTVQGVGLRPWVHRLATAHGLGGHVLNDTRGVLIEVQGPAADVEDFLAAVRGDAGGDDAPPPLARIDRCRVTDIEPAAASDDGRQGRFEIRFSQALTPAATQVSPDMVICDDCRRELLDPADRRYRYPFINCTNCGPRYSIIFDVPYDRPRTTMKVFAMCPDCRREYDDPADRRFHAQPNACPACGPRLELYDADGGGIDCDDPVEFVRGKLLDGAIVAIKSLTGFHLACQARSREAVAELRRRKRRDRKPLALMVADCEQAARLVHLDEAARQLIESPERPIVLALRRAEAEVAPGVAPRSLYLGLMLPCAPLQVLLFAGDFPSLVMTSANISEEPMCRQNGETVRRMRGIADYYLLHNRDIRTVCDDSLTTAQCGRPLVIRRARGYAPRPIPLPRPEPPQTILAVGPELKNCVCLTRGGRAYLSQHIGDLKNPLATAYFEETIDKLSRLLEVRPAVVAHDLHPAYHSTRYARRLEGVRLTAVQHHHAHIAAVSAEHGLTEPLVGLAMDGTGYGTDGTVWGSEFLHVRPDGTFTRLGHLRYTALPGGDAAIEKVVRVAWSLLLEAFGEEADSVAGRLLPTTTARERTVWRRMIEQGLNSPPACGLGRLFDAVSALAGLATESTYEGQAAIELEAAAEDGVTERFSYQVADSPEGPGFEISALPLVRDLVAALEAGQSAGNVSARFHNTVAAFLLDGAQRLRRITGETRIALSGGCFLNRRLTERLVAALQSEGFRVYRQREVSPGDGGLALGQVEVARQRMIAGTV